MRYPAQTMKGLTPVLVLEALGGEDLSGVEILERIRQRTRGGIDIPEGTIYPLLHRLETRGLVQSRWVASSGKRRRSYAATQSGKRCSASERAQWSSLITALQHLWGPAKETA